MNTIGKRILELLEEKNMSQRDLANKVNVTEVTISRYVNNEREPRTEILLNIAETLNTSIEYLVGKTNSKKPINITDLKNEYVDFARKLQESNVSVERAVKIIDILRSENNK